MTSPAEFDATLTPEKRARALYYFFGWQGGTAHQLAAETGLTVAAILYEPLAPERTRGLCGFSAIRTCSRDWRRDVLAPKARGDVTFWHDAIRGFWTTGPLDGGAAS